MQTKKIRFDPGDDAEISAEAVLETVLSVQKVEKSDNSSKTKKPDRIKGDTLS